MQEQPAEGDGDAAAKLAAAKAAAQAAESALTMKFPVEGLGDDAAAAKMSAAKAAAKAAEESLVFGFDNVEPEAEKPAEVKRSKKDQAQVDRMAKFDADLRKVTSRDVSDQATSSDLDTRGMRMAKGVTEDAKTDLGFDDSKLKVRSLNLPLLDDPSGGD
jgi:hypothetical protein